VSRAAGALAAALALAACEPVVPVGRGYERLVEAPVGPVRALDVLFVVDDSGSMEGEQALLAASMALFGGALAAAPGGPLDLHVAVTSTDLGTAPFDNDRCEGEGVDGRFLVGPAGAACGVDGAFLVDEAGAPGQPRRINYPDGRLAETLACMTGLGANGCGFEQPLEAARRALDETNPEAAAFLRPHALLAVFFITDEDDCSAADRSLFDPAQDGRDEPLGELSSFRCFERGVTCEGPADPRAPGPRTGCQPAADGPLTPVSAAVDFLRGLKRGPALVLVGGVFGDAGPVAVEEVDGRLALADVCASSEAAAAPAVRLHALADAFPGPDATASICDPDPAARPAALAASAVAALAATRCLRGAPRDAEPDEPGVQPSCRAFTITDRDRRELPPCGPEAAAWAHRSATPSSAEGGPAVLCFAVEEDEETCGFVPGGLALGLHGPLPEGADVRVQLDCLADPPDPEPDPDGSDGGVD
jgi:hypothetical protein